MHLRPADTSDLEAVRSGAAEFRANWRALGSPVLDCSFEGTIDDVRALDYLDYEGLAYSEAGAALVWGNVLATQMPLAWYVDDSLGALILRPVDQHAAYTPLAIWPFGRVYEAQRGKETQFDKYRWLFDQVVLQLLGHDLLEPPDRDRLLDLMTDHEGWSAARMWELALGRLDGTRGDRDL